MSEEVCAEQKLYQERSGKAKQLQELGVNPYGNGFKPESTSGELLAKYSPQSHDELEAQKPGPFTLAGRVVSVRDFGKAAFIVVQDRGGSLQVHVKKDALGEEAFKVFKLVDLGDFVGVKGTLFKSKTGELTLAASSLCFLGKALRPLPGRFTTGEDAEAKALVERQALHNVEERYRRRYLDLLSNPAVRETFKKRTKLVQFIRHYLDQRDFLEVETPMMHSLVSGATARPFKTHHNALGLDLFMRVAPELHLKRLVAGGFDRVYEINRSFRNEGISTRHNPEFTMLEFYQAYATYEDLMDLTEDMLSQAALTVTGSLLVKYGEHHIDFKKGWPRIPMTEAIRQRVKDLSEADFADVDKLRAVALRKVEEKERAAIGTMNQGELIGALFEQYVEGDLVQPTFITQFPVETSPLARRSDANPAVTDRFALLRRPRSPTPSASSAIQWTRPALPGSARCEGPGQQETMDYDHDYIRALSTGCLHRRKALN